MIDGDLAIVTTEAVKVFLVDGPPGRLARFEVQLPRDSALTRRLLRYNLLVDARHDLPVHSAAILLRPKSDGPELVGQFERRPSVGGCSVRFSK